MGWGNTHLNPPREINETYLHVIHNVRFLLTNMFTLSALEITLNVLVEKFLNSPV